jgi:hypothetical protein
MSHVSLIILKGMTPADGCSAKNAEEKESDKKQRLQE